MAGIRRRLADGQHVLATELDLGHGRLPHFRCGGRGHLVEHDRCDIRPRDRSDPLVPDALLRTTSCVEVECTGSEHRDEVVQVVGGEVGGQVAARLRQRGVVRHHRQLAEGEALRDRKAPALIARRVDRELGMGVEAGQLGVGDARRQHAHLAVESARAHVLVEERVGVPAQPAHADEVRHRIGSALVDESRPRVKREQVVLARLHGADEQRVGPRPRRVRRVELAGGDPARQPGDPARRRSPPRDRGSSPRSPSGSSARSPAPVTPSGPPGPGSGRTAC